MGLELVEDVDTEGVRNERVRDRWVNYQTIHRV